LKLYFLTLLIFFSLNAFALDFTGKVVGVIDGDTIDVLDQSKTLHRIRLAGIDAPEHSQPFGKRSKEHLSEIVFGKQVKVEYNKKDRFERAVGKIFVNGIDANLSQVKSGFAWHYSKYAKEQSAEDRALYATTENAARLNHLGLWRDAKPTPPWDFRHGDKKADQEKMTEADVLECPCSGTSMCTGSRGGTYCLAANGKKKY
jgi:endonuclease YncB( thermonuclease family)